MFLNFLKVFLLKRRLKKRVFNVNNDFSQKKIETIGILIDDIYFNEAENIFHEIIENNIKKSNVSWLIFKNKVTKNDTIEAPFFSKKDINWKGFIEKTEVSDFVSKKFDLLVNYYDIEKAPLLLITCQSKSNFKVGFSSIDYRLNHLMIKTEAKEFKIFTKELFKYLKILKKI